MYPNAVALHIHSDAASMVLSEARSRAGGHFYLGDAQEPLKDRPPQHPQ